MKRRNVTLARVLVLVMLSLLLLNCGMGISKDALENYLSGERYYKSMMYEEAIVEYKKAIEEEPSFALPHLGIGKSLSALGRFEDAVLEFKKAMDLDPKNDEILATVAIAYIERGLYDEGLMFLDRAKTNDPQNPKIFLYMGMYHAKKKEYKKAIEQYNTAIEKDKKFKDPYIYMSQLYCCADNPMYVKPDKAVTYAEKALAIAPDDPLALDALAQAYFSQGNYDKAIETEEKAVALLPGHPILREHLETFNATVSESAEDHNRKGAELLAEGNYDAAAIEFKKAITIDPKFSDGYYNLGKVYSQLENYHEAEKYYSEAIELSPDNHRYHYNLAIVYSKMGLLEESEKEYLFAIDIDPYYDKAHNNLGALYVSMGRLEEALSEFEKAFELNPKTSYKTNIDMVKQMMRGGGEAVPSPESPDGDIIQY
jgi:superkiller protein 3